MIPLMRSALRRSGECEPADLLECAERRTHPFRQLAIPSLVVGPARNPARDVKTRRGKGEGGGEGRKQKRDKPRRLESRSVRRWRKGGQYITPILSLTVDEDRRELVVCSRRKERPSRVGERETKLHKFDERAVLLCFSSS